MKWDWMICQSCAPFYYSKRYPTLIPSSLFRKRWVHFERGYETDKGMARQGRCHASSGGPGGSDGLHEMFEGWEQRFICRLESRYKQKRTKRWARTLSR